MKDFNFANRLCAFFALLSILALASCSADSDSAVVPAIPAEAPFSLILKALDAEGLDVTTKGDVSEATLFVFDENNDFVKQIDLDESTLLQRRKVEIQCPDTKTITVIAWGGISSENEQVSALSRANIISDLQVQLKTNNGVAAVPGDLFYGQCNLQRESMTKSSVAKELTLQRKVSSVSLKTDGLVKFFGSQEGKYVYKVKSSNSAFNYNGELTGDQVEYNFSASFDKNGTLVAETSPVLPASHIVVELYKDNELLFSAEKDKNGEILSANEGKQMNLTFKFSSSVTTKLVVTSWNTVVQYVVF